MGTPASVGVIWSNPSSSRVVNVSSSPSDEEYGDGAAGTPKQRTVQGIVATETVNGDIHRIVWQQPDAAGPCTFWTVVSQGLSPSELTNVLESVDEES
jgi:hypothetical protein